MSATTLCARCGRTLTWATTVNGKAMPVDPYSDSNGNVRLQPHQSGGYTAHVMTKLELADPSSGPRYLAHFATCGRT